MKLTITYCPLELPLIVFFGVGNGALISAFAPLSFADLLLLDGKAGLFLAIISLLAV
jgi:hypothetical protein